MAFKVTNCTTANKNTKVKISQWYSKPTQNEKEHTNEVSYLHKTRSACNWVIISTANGLLLDLPYTLVISKLYVPKSRQVIESRLNHNYTFQDTI